MALFFIIVFVLGGLSALIFTWIFVAIASAILGASCIAILLYNGASTGVGMELSFLTLLLFQSGYLLVGIMRSLLKQMRILPQTSTATGAGSEIHPLMPTLESDKSTGNIVRRVGD